VRRSLTIHQCRRQPIDLPTVLRLAGAQNLDVQIARERLNEAQASRETALEQFVPSLTPASLITGAMAWPRPCRRERFRTRISNPMPPAPRLRRR